MFSIVDRSLHVGELGLWIDSMRTRERCYVSHGHSDHAREHATVVATPATAAICRVRFARREQRVFQPSLLDRRVPPAPCRFEEHAFNAPWDECAHLLTLFSAGHVLGSSQLMIEGERGRFVYTGDFKIEPSFSCEPPEVKECDVVLMECTYGRPQYAFPPRAEIAGAMVEFARAALENDSVPLFYAYSLGKAQEAMAILGRTGIPLTVHRAVARIAHVYADSGFTLPAWEAYDAQTYAGGSALIWPTSGDVPKALRTKTVRTAVLTGWVLDRGTLFRYGSEHGFPLSDHADYPSLLRYLELAQPKKVLLNHGWRDFVHRLRGLGFDAEYLEENAQLALF